MALIKGPSEEGFNRRHSRARTRVEAYRAKHGRMKLTRPKAIDLVKKHRRDIEEIREDGGSQEDAILFIEMEEGGLVHKVDTLRKSISQIVGEWRNPPRGRDDLSAALSPVAGAERISSQDDDPNLEEVHAW